MLKNTCSKTWLRADFLVDRSHSALVAFYSILRFFATKPRHELLYPNNLFSPLIPLEHSENLPTTPNPQRSGYFLVFIVSLLVMTLNLIHGRSSGLQIRRHLTALFLFGAFLAVTDLL